MLTKSGLRLGLALPQTFLDRKVDSALVRDVAIRAETLGYDDLWLTEGIVASHTTLEPLTTLAFVGAVTSRIRLGVSVIILNQRNPLQLAKALASLDQLSGGRIIAGLGLGDGTRLYPAFGIGEERRVARFNEALRVMKALWTQPSVTLDGDFWQLQDISIEPKPLQQPLPVWFGAHSPAAMRRAARQADGWMCAGSTRLEDVVPLLNQMRSSLAEVGREEAGFALSKRIYMVVDVDENRARRRLADWFSFQYGSAERAPVFGLAGSPQRCVEVLQGWRDAGYQHILLNICDDQQAQLELLTEKVVPEL